MRQIINLLERSRAEIGAQHEPKTGCTAFPILGSRFLPVALLISICLAALPGPAASEELEDPAPTEPTWEQRSAPEAKPGPKDKEADPYAKDYETGRLAFWFNDYAKAMELWKPLAEEGYMKAQASVGWLYHLGKGVEQDYVTAVEWYRKAADQGYPIAQNNLGVMYEHGLGVEQSFEEALKWYRLAADQDYMFANYNLAVLYNEGKGIEPNKDEAIRLLRRAHTQGVDEAKDLLEQLGIKVEERKQDHQKALERLPQHRFGADTAEE